MIKSSNFLKLANMNRSPIFQLRPSSVKTTGETLALASLAGSPTKRAPLPILLFSWCFSKHQWTIIVYHQNQSPSPLLYLSLHLSSLSCWSVKRHTMQPQPSPHLLFLTSSNQKLRQDSRREDPLSFYNASLPSSLPSEIDNNQTRASLLHAPTSVTHWSLKPTGHYLLGPARVDNFFKLFG
ncbi:hypothetical protein H5410_015476 [Solanum commersonii]|uniref:Uncharacterized protein n=1 Tax=Solanum commersonii TaxID=4109 RepID=A0A9J5ZUI1_SOLCO|nr:hypothetical protein H5410_015476 [Solanum commersonii]